MMKSGLWNSHVTSSSEIFVSLKKKIFFQFCVLKKKIRKMPYLSFSPNIIGSPTATATPQMINMDPKIALWFPEVWAWEYSIGCLIARYLKFFVQNWDSMTVAKLLEPIFEKNEMLPINTDCHKIENWGCRANYVHGHVNVTNNVR